MHGRGEMSSSPSCSQGGPEGRPEGRKREEDITGAQEGGEGSYEAQEKTCRACLEEIGPGDLTPAEMHLCQACLGKRREELQALRDQIAAQYVLLRTCRAVKPCLLKGLGFMPEAFRERRAAEALAADFLAAGFPPQETYNLLRKAVPGIRSGQTWALIAEASAKGAWSCREMREKLGIDCQGCPLQYYQAPKRAAPKRASLPGLS
jgi:hypothetical protein